jgi:hypothetical protein
MSSHTTVSNASQHIGNGINSAHTNSSSFLPTRLDHAGNFAFIRQLAETNPAQTKAAHISPGTTALATAMMYPYRKLPTLFSHDHRFFGHYYFTS